METKFLSTLKLAHINSWDWNLETRDLYLVNASDIEEMQRISPLMAMPSVTIPNYPDILFEKNLVSPEDAYLVRKYEKLILDADVNEEFSFRLPFKTIDNHTIWLQFFGIITQNKNNKACRAIGYYTDVTKQIEIAKKAYDFDAVQEVYDNIYATVLFGLSADYSNVFWIDLDSEEFKPIRLDPVSEKMIGPLIEKVSTYQDLLKYYIRHFVVEDDQEKLQFLLDPQQVTNHLRDKQIYTCNYRSERMGETVYCQVKIARGTISHLRPCTDGSQINQASVP